MITSIEIENLRGIAHGKLEGLTELSVIIGKNGSGKSSILDAIMIIADKDIRNSIRMQEYASARYPGTANPLRWLFHKGVSSDIHIFAKINKYNIEMIIDEEKVKKITTVTDAGKPASFVDAKTNVKLIGKYTGLKQPMIQNLFSDMVMNDRYDEANLILKSIIPGVKDCKILIEDNNPYLFISYPNHNVPIAVAGDGIYALAQLGLELALRPGGIALIEEPEIHLHPAAIRQTAKVIWGAVRRGVQVILTTHSLELIDGLLEFANGEEELDKLSVFRTLLDDGQLKVSHITGENVEFARNQIGDDLR